MERPIFKPRVPDAAGMRAYFDELRDAYPFFATVGVGQTLLGTPLVAGVLGTGKTEALYLGAHRGTDGAAALALVHFLYELCEACAVGRKLCGRDVRTLLAAKRLTVLPLVNADGASLVWHGVEDNNPLRERLLRMNGSEDFRDWHANARGVDLDYNYDAGWEAYQPIAAENGVEPGASKYAGTSPESEPEVAAVASYLRAAAPRTMVVLRQGSGKLRFASLDGAPTGARQVAAQLAAATGYKLAAPSGTAAYGSALEYFLTAYRRPAFQFECGSEPPAGAGVPDGPRIHVGTGVPDGPSLTAAVCDRSQSDRASPVQGEVPASRAEGLPALTASCLPLTGKGDRLRGMRCASAQGEVPDSGCRPYASPVQGEVAPQATEGLSAFAAQPAPDPAPRLAALAAEEAAIYLRIRKALVTLPTMV